MRWALATVAPWAMSAGMLVSFTASAGQDPNPGATLIQRLDASEMSDLAAGPWLLAATSAFDMPGLNLSGAIRSANLSLDMPDRYAPLPQPQLRPDLKAFASVFPQVDRDRKGDQIIPLRPTLTRLDESWRHVAARELASLFVAPHDERTAASGFSSEFAEPATTPPVGFEVWPDLLAADPVQEQVLVLDIEADAMERATPIIARSPELFWLETPEVEEAVSDPAKISDDTTTIAKSEPQRSRYADLIAPQQMAREQRCLAEAVYFESRSESERGQAAVAQVVLNRVQSGIYPSTICGVVYQNRHRHLACQFTFACEGKSLAITEPEPWRVAVQVASDVVSGKTYLADVGASTHYHARYVRPYWAKRLRKMDVIGTHIFYKLRPGQT
jgi:spore germination cell wall hydrolase CwlJ-like protein